jgi:hypothetical protein
MRDRLDGPGGFGSWVGAGAAEGRAVEWKTEARDLEPILGRNDPCHCGSGKKYKQCCLGKDEEKARAARAKAAAEAPVPEAEAAAPPPTGPKHKTRQPWKKTATNTHGFGKTSLPRKVGGG